MILDGGKLFGVFGCGSIGIFKLEESVKTFSKIIFEFKFFMKDWRPLKLSGEYSRLDGFLSIICIAEYMLKSPIKGFFFLVFSVASMRSRKK